MGTGAITGYIDVAQIVLYLFWIFFFGLVYYLQMESKRADAGMGSRSPVAGFRAALWAGAGMISRRLKCTSPQDVCQS